MQNHWKYLDQQQIAAGIEYQIDPTRRCSSAADLERGMNEARLLARFGSERAVGEWERKVWGRLHIALGHTPEADVTVARRAVAYLMELYDDPTRGRESRTATFPATVEGAVSALRAMLPPEQEEALLRVLYVEGVAPGAFEVTCRFDEGDEKFRVYFDPHAIESGRDAQIEDIDYEELT